MRFLLITLISLCVHLPLLSKIEDETTEVVGEGFVKTSPDYIIVKLRVNSECQPNPKSAQKSTDDITKKIDDYLSKFNLKKDKYFKILIDGGFTTPFSRWIRPPVSSATVNHDIEICRNTFQKSTEITLKMGIRANFDKIFSDMQGFVFSQFAQKSADDLENPRTYATINIPSPEITREHRIILEREAYDLAVRDAKANFLALTKSCEQHPYKIIKIKELSNNIPWVARAVRPYTQSAVPMALESNVDAAPVRFDNIEITKKVELSFKFDGSFCYESKK
jgi:uncharacterized protein YggE